LVEQFTIIRAEITMNTPKTRRSFIKDVALVGGLSGLAGCSTSRLLQSESTSTLRNLKSPLAINMWDYSWLLRAYPGGGFDNWDRVLDDLQIRGYNALRIDAFPQFIAHDDNGYNSEEYDIKANKGKVLWGNKDAVTIRPQSALIEFLQKCIERNIEVGISSWFASHGTNRNLAFSGVEGLVRAWDATLKLLKENNLIDKILYVDILNEYPLWHGYQWLKDELNRLAEDPKSKPVKWDFLNSKGQKKYNKQQIDFYNKFINEVIAQLKSKWPHVDFFASQTNTLNTPWQDLDVSQFDILDIHIWMIYNYNFSKATGYFDNIHTLVKEENFEKCFSLMSSYWNANRGELQEWLEIEVQKRKNLADSHNIPLGNTEGWGAVMWMDHKDLSWDFIKEAGIMGAEVGQKFGYAFNCSSNFNHPQFKGIWNDISWHQKVTSIIKGH